MGPVTESVRVPVPHHEKRAEHQENVALQAASGAVAGFVFVAALFVLAFVAVCAAAGVLEFMAQH